MPRATSGSATHRWKVRVRRAAKGFRGARKHYRLAMENIVHAQTNAFRDRRRRKREFRSLWIIRLSAACELRGLRYSQFIAGCRQANIVLNRKMLSELAIHDPAVFDAVAELVKTQLGKQAA